MGEYLPFSDRHSIQEAQINLFFPGQFEKQDIEAARGAAHAELSDILPRLAEVHGGSVTIEVTDPSTPVTVVPATSGLAGFQFSNVQGNAQPGRVLRLAGNSLSVSVMDYDSWITSRQVASTYFKPVLTAVPLDRNPVIAFGLRFIDRYTFSGPPDEARACLLFAVQSQHLTPHVFDSGASWHCNTGWFDSLGDDRVLHNLNVASALIDLSSTVTIEHNATAHLCHPRQSIGSLFPVPTGQSGLIEVLDILHDRNKDILREILVSEMLDRIGLLP